jgi:type III secretory pathway component EscR
MSAEFVGSNSVDPGMALWIALALLPLLLVACTAFTKLSIVLAALRVGLGAETLLPAGLMLAFALVLSVVAMGPTGLAVAEVVDARGGLELLLASRGEAAVVAWGEVLSPFVDFMRRHAHPAEIDFFSELTHSSGSDPRVLVPAFMVS